MPDLIRVVFTSRIKKTHGDPWRRWWQILMMGPLVYDPEDASQAVEAG